MTASERVRTPTAVVAETLDCRWRPARPDHPYDHLCGVEDMCMTMASRVVTALVVEGWIKSTPTKGLL